MAINKNTAFKLVSVSLNLPVFSSQSKSLKSSIVKYGLRGKINNDKGYAYVEALKDISFNFISGDRVGIIGSNGAGKTTLLKMLAGVYHPTIGEVKKSGRVVSMLDIHLGMDEEFSGIENIFLRGYYLGYSTNEIKIKVKEIISFSELDDYINLPIRTYSSGMRLRLAFSISTSFDAEILLMDENILAGDASFISKAKHRLESYLHKSDILFLASHSDDVIRSYCNKAIWMQSGKIMYIGDINEAINLYHKVTE